MSWKIKLIMNPSDLVGIMTGRGYGNGGCCNAILQIPSGLRLLQTKKTSFQLFENSHKIEISVMLLDFSNLVALFSFIF